MKEVLEPKILKKAVRKAYRLMYESGELQQIFNPADSRLMKYTSDLWTSNALAQPVYSSYLESAVS